MTNDQQSKHPSLDASTAEALLSRLAGDDAFRTLFASDPATALKELGLDTKTIEASLAGASCLRVKSLASSEELTRARELLLGYLTGVTAYSVVHCLEAGEVQNKLTLR